MKLRKIIALVFSMVFLLASIPTLAAVTAADVKVTITDANSEGNVIRLLLSVENNSDEDIEYSSIACTSATVSKLTEAAFSLPALMTFTVKAGQTNSVILTTSKLGYTMTGAVTATFQVAFEGVTSGTPITANANVAFDFATSPTTTPDPSATEVDFFRLSAYDRSKKLVPTPSGDAGDKISIRVPLYCLRGPAVDISITPKLSTSLEEFPFDISQVDYTQYYSGGAESGEVIQFDYNFKLSKKTTSGVKKVDFIISYRDGNNWSYNSAPKTTTVSVYVNVVNGYEGATPGASPVISQPKLILEKYSLSADKIYAGEEFEVYFTLKNTSTIEDVQNIQISITDTADTGKLLPAENGSNTIYISKIAKGESYDVTYKMQSAADIDPKAYKLGIALAYEGAKNIVAYTASDTISVTLLQRIRLKIDTPVFYDESFVGSTTGVYFAMYNMGRSAVYNCMVSVEGDGLQMEETYFGGTVAAGGTMSADFNIITNTAGQIEGFIVVTYEDSLGEQMEERIPISLYVNDMGGGEGMYDPGKDPGIYDPGIYDPGIDVGAGASTGLPLWAWIAIGVGALGCAAVVLIVIFKKRRTKQLEGI